MYRAYRSLGGDDSCPRLSYTKTTRFCRVKSTKDCILPDWEISLGTLFALAASVAFTWTLARVDHYCYDYCYYYYYYYYYYYSYHIVHTQSYCNTFCPLDNSTKPIQQHVVLHRTRLVAFLPRYVTCVKPTHRALTRSGQHHLLARDFPLASLPMGHRRNKPAGMDFGRRYGNSVV